MVVVTLRWMVKSLWPIGWHGFISMANGGTGILKMFVGQLALGRVVWISGTRAGFVVSAKISADVGSLSSLETISRWRLARLILLKKPLPLMSLPHLRWSRLFPLKTK